MTVNNSVINNNGSKVTTEQSTGQDGSINLRTIIDDAVAANINRQGSKTSRSLKTAGLPPRVIGR